MRSIPFCFWWFFTTTTTVGYGDFYPTTTGGKFVAMITFYIGIILLALPITIIGGNFTTFYKRWVMESAVAEEVDQTVKRRACTEFSHLSAEELADALASPETKDSTVAAVTGTATV